VSCGAVVDETFSVRERSDVASRFANTFFEKKGGRQASKWHVARPPRSITVCFIANVQFNVVVWLFCAFKAHANSHIHIMDSEFAISLARGFFFASHLTRIRFSLSPLNPPRRARSVDPPDVLNASSSRVQLRAGQASGGAQVPRVSTTRNATRPPELRVSL
jgi:hypothetical protein